MSHVYAAYGECVTLGQPARSAYAGERAEPDTGEYMLGSRLYSPVLRRFLNPDALSPLGDGGFNRYAYCGGDPVNRVDPDGQAWWPWQVAARQASRSVAGSRPAAGSTPDMAASSDAPVLDTATVAAGLAFVPTDDIFGVVGRAQGAASAGSALRNRAPARDARFVGAQLARGEDAPRYRIDVVPANQVPLERYRISRTGELRLTARWIRRRDPLDERITHWAADTSINGAQLAYPIKRIGSMPIVDGNNRVYLYSGVHGDREGDNWLNRRRQEPDPEFYRRDRRSRRRYASYLPGRRLKVEDISGITTDQMIEKMSRPGVHLHAYCYGAVDNLMLDILGADPLPVYLKS